MAAKRQLDTPWGPAQDMHEIALGLYLVETPSHGGYFLEQEINDLVPHALRESTFCGNGFSGWYEEDCDWAIVVVCFPEFFSSKKYNEALNIMEAHHAIAWKSVSRK